MALEAYNVVSLSPTSRPKGFRVRVFHMPADWNALGHTLTERHFRTKKIAAKWAREMVRAYRARPQEFDL